MVLHHGRASSALEEQHNEIQLRLALGFCFSCGPIRKDCFPVSRTDVTWLLVLLSFLADASADSHLSLKLPFEVDFFMKLVFPVVLLLQMKRSN